MNDSIPPFLHDPDLRFREHVDEYYVTRLELLMQRIRELATDTISYSAIVDQFLPYIMLERRNMTHRYAENVLSWMKKLIKHTLIVYRQTSLSYNILRCKYWTLNRKSNNRVSWFNDALPRIELQMVRAFQYLTSCNLWLRNLIEGNV